ncbi:MAG: MraY family glycosyltransferase [Thiotrichales bacterium]
MDMIPLLTIFLTLAISIVGTAALIRFGAKLIPLDTPNHRSLHVNPTPRSGGLAILTAFLIGFVLTSASDLLTVTGFLVSFGALALFVVALLDDRKNLSPALRLVAQVLAAGLLLAALFAGGEPLWRAGIMYKLILLFVIVWSINLFNFMDGMDGFAASMAIIGFSALALLALRADQQAYAALLFLIVAATAGFLFFNFPAAKIFLGDVGSTLLGYAMAGASLWGIKLDIFPWWVPLLVFAPFWVDATLTLLRRLIRGEKVWVAHREHWYQKAVLAGNPVRKVLLLEVSVMLVCSGIALVGSMQ